MVKAYLTVSGTIFALIVAAHLWRAFLEGFGLVRDPIFVLLTLLAAGLSLWAWRLLGTLRKSA